MGHGINSITERIKLQWQTSSTELINATPNCDRLNSMKHSSVLPHVFTEQGIAMLSGVLNSDRAIMVNIQIMRAFIQLKRMLLTNAGLRRKIEEMEKKYDKQFAIVFQAIKQLIEPPLVKEKRITGFR